MNDLTWAVAMFAAAGALMIGVAIAITRSKRRRTVRTEGTVTGIEHDSGVYRIVTFTPEGDEATAPQAVTFRTLHSDEHEVGDRVPVFYDPREPTNAETMAAGFKRIAWIIGAGGGGLFFIGAGAMHILGQMDAAADQATAAFLDAVRSGDEAAVRATTTQGATLDHDFLEVRVRPSTGFAEQSSVLIGTDRQCVRGRILPGDIKLVLSVQRVQDEWRVQRAGNRDPECESHFDAP